MVKIKISPLLTRNRENEKMEFTLEKAITVRDLIIKLAKMHDEKLEARIFTTDGRLKDFIMVYVNNKDVRRLNKEHTKIKDSDTVMILPIVGGG